MEAWSKKNWISDNRDVYLSLLHLNCTWRFDPSHDSSTPWINCTCSNCVTVENTLVYVYTKATSTMKHFNLYTSGSHLFSKFGLKGLFSFPFLYAKKVLVLQLVSKTALELCEFRSRTRFSTSQYPPRAAKHQQDGVCKGNPRPGQIKSLLYLCRASVCPPGSSILISLLKYEIIPISIWKLLVFMSRYLFSSSCFRKNQCMLKPVHVSHTTCVVKVIIIDGRYRLGEAPS